MPSAERGALETVIVTGLSGAGRSTAAKCLEDFPALIEAASNY